jgi:type III secretion protein V
VRGLFSSLLSGDVRTLFQRHSDLALATLVALIVGMMIVPLPAFGLDLAIALNVAFSVMLLLLAIYADGPLRIATFPSLLLLTTLFRLAIEVSATRLVLLKANAGQVIHAFGSYVVAGNMVVGVVVFLILTIIQYVVIAKGAGRVAEVGARFTLDAMPGKQMAIDAELRAGHIDRNQARGLREALARESQFFGSMDGAMRFVKGDAVAGLVVLLVNIVGGMAIAVIQRGMDVESALRTYTLLTIGEGLVAQIPALVIASAAGILVTRVSSEDESGHLGADIGRQILAQPKALASTAGLLVLLALVPGLPTVPFLVLGVLVGVSARAAMRRVPAASKAGDGTGLPSSPQLVPIALALSPRAVRLLEQTAPLGRLASDWSRVIRERHYQTTGIPIPDLVVRRLTGGAPTDDWVVEIQEIAVARGAFTAEETELDAVISAQAIVQQVLAVLDEHGHRFVGIQETQRLLDGLAHTHPDLVREVVSKQVSLVVLAELLQRLAKESVSLRNLPDILAALARHPCADKQVGQLVERVRTALQRQLTFKFRQPDGSLAVFFLDSMIEEAVRESIRKGETDSHLALEPQLRQDIVRAVGHAVADVASPVILTSSEIRPHVRAIIETEQPHVAVLAYPEIVPDAKLSSRGRISVAGPT